MIIIKINGEKFEFPLCDAHSLGELRKAVKAFNDCIDQVNEMDISTKEKVIKKKTLIRIFLDGLLGKGATDKIFKGDMNFKECSNVLIQFNRQVDKYYSKLSGIVVDFELKKRKRECK